MAPNDYEEYQPYFDKVRCALRTAIIGNVGCEGLEYCGNPNPDAHHKRMLMG